ncbi:MAG TPA: hypothetical protein VE860_11755 [Chthoniobacterales bacterium]|jgi:hypothetical protein|nr:hypothetical protein [Chthoniobacterales bacterium]
MKVDGIVWDPVKSRTIIYDASNGDLRSKMLRTYGFPEVERTQPNPFRTSFTENLVLVVDAPYIDYANILVDGNTYGSVDLQGSGSSHEIVILWEGYHPYEGNHTSTPYKGAGSFAKTRKKAKRNTLRRTIET